MDRLDELRQRYSQSLPQKGRELESLWRRWATAPDDRNALTELHQQVHRLSGSAPAYGFEELGALAQPIDASIAEWLGTEATERIALKMLVDRLSPRMRALVQALAF